ncbi:MAG: ferritin-like domain-containing protein [Nocardioidaceae bacterium]
MSSKTHAVQQALAAEHAALYVYDVVGGRVSVSAHPRLARRVASAYTTHRGRRDQLTAMVRAAHATPVAAAVSYQLPTPCRTTPELELAALLTEQRCTQVYAALVGASSQATRQYAINALADSAVRELGFGGIPAAFPGLPEM